MTDNQQKVLYEVVPDDDIILPMPKEWLCAYHPVQYIYLRPVAAPAGEREDASSLCEYCGYKLPDHEERCILKSTTPPTGKAAGVAERVAEVLAEEDGYWHPCSGCHETVDGQETGHYPYSDVFKCHPGSGCRECGGIGIVWEYGLNNDVYNIESAQPSETGEGKFAEWIDANKYKRERGRKGVFGNWYKPAAGYGGGTPTTFTTSELYQLYLSNEREKTQP